MKRIMICILPLMFTVFLLSPAVFSQDQKKEKSESSEQNPGSTGGDTVNYCVDCHKSLPERFSKPVTEWKKSIHATVGNNCNLCHGGNSEINDKKKAKEKQYKFVGKPDKKEITDFCGRGDCHATALSQFKKGPHYKSVLETNSPNCTHCHGVHGILRSSRKLIKDETCTSCHDVKYSREIISSISIIEDGLDKLEENINFLKMKNIEIENIEKRINNTRHLYHQLVHVFSREDIVNTKRIIELEIENLLADSKTKVALSKRLDLFYILMFSFSVCIIVIIAMYSIIMYMRRK